MDTVSRTDVETTKRSLGSNYYLKVKNLSHGFIYDNYYVIFCYNTNNIDARNLRKNEKSIPLYKKFD